MTEHDCGLIPLEWAKRWMAIKGRPVTPEVEARFVAGEYPLQMLVEWTAEQISAD